MSTIHPDGNTTAGAIRPLRRLRSSAPVSAELYTSTTDPLVIAFQTSAMFAAPESGTLTLEAPRQLGCDYLVSAKVTGSLG